MKKQYVVRFSDKESDWADISSFDSLEEAREEYEHQLDMDEKEGWTDNWTQIVEVDGEDEKVIEEHYGEDF